MFSINLVTGFFSALLMTSVAVAGPQAAQVKADAKTSDSKTADAKTAASRRLDDSSLRVMIGQMILVGFNGVSADAASVVAVRQEIADGSIGGIMYLSDNVSDRTHVAAMNAAFLAANRKLPPFISVDEEGGAIARLTADNGFHEVPAAVDVASKFSPRGAYELYSRLATDLREWGFNLNFGPVADLNVNPANPIIGKLGRSFSANPEIVAQYGAAFVRAHRDAGVVTTLKHFPGHGSSSTDSHKGLADVSGTWSSQELIPFRKLINAGYADSVMVGHLYDRALQKGEAVGPASLSSAIVTGLLRKDLGFEGVVFSDDLQMDAVENSYSFGGAVVRAVEAGDDILIFSNHKNPDADLPEKVIDILMAEARRNPVVAANIVKSFAKISALKASLAQRGGPMIDLLSTKSITPDPGNEVTPADVEMVRRDMALKVVGLPG
ncbi:glycoside hydrolase family 3 protein [Mesorhizobium opportunistum]|uniref:beta-N-acetylhexosaminidase n=1 Tax=Mesorhizobium opportunistum (strain LMG 24607 / HAMBI 3007 / WSM2075) TaxID=536019 RepID=F7Y3J4_MESOW|nr:glycoside hydrolase family 3 N-terminal domain-containing protein [Mesorhizobium opportunistum]AEH88387.1 glycoside hydrolase family 3 domain protein [Mesorhizobium opportunistum WSM2075]